MSLSVRRMENGGDDPERAAVLRRVDSFEREVLWDKDQGEYAESMRAMSWRIRSGHGITLEIASDY
ncbi:hypothetical protein COLO4_22923 [Corchorus olitorius]|uniref:Uncharacterized protein n=1 Tax=Corchorus olitorius TaxID=93759 RepID=A0A1R3IJ22_9ROSI|nr:hypothetical protein COLO4_22923 [Corchorus olitorius]